MEERKIDEEVGDTIVVKKKKGLVDEVVRDSAVDTDELKEDVEDASEEEEVVFTLPEMEGDEEVLADMTPEEAKEFLRKRDEEEKALKEKLAALISEGDSLLASGKKELAEEKYFNAVETDKNNVEANYKYASARTSAFSDYSDFDSFEETYNSSYANAGEDFRAQVKENAYKPISEKIKELTASAEQLKESIEQKRQARREKFAADYKKKLTYFIACFVPLIICAALSVIFGLKINAVQGNAFLILTLVFAVLTLICLILFLIFARKLSTSANRVRENEKDESTKEGREYISLKEKISFLSGILE